MDDRRVADLAAAVADGEPIEWDRESLGLAGYQERLAHQLRALSGLTASHPVSSPTARRLAWPLALGRIAAIVCCAVGVVGLARLMSGAEGGRYALFIAVLAVFSGSALYLDIAGRDRRALALALGFWTVGASFAARGTVALADAWPSVGVLSVVAALRPEAFFGGALWAFARDFPNASRGMALDRVVLPATNVATAVGTALFTINLIPLANASLSTWPPLAALTFQRTTGNTGLFWSLTFGLALPALLVIALRARAAVSADRPRIRLFMYGIAASVLPVTAEVVAENLIPPFFRIMDTPAGRYYGGWVVYPPLFLWPMVTAYAVAVGDVLPLRVALRQFLRHVAARWLLIALAAAPIVGLARHIGGRLDRPLGETLAAPGGPALSWLAGIGLAVLVLRKELLRTLDRWVTGSRSDHAVSLARLSDRLQHTRTPLEVTAVLAQAAEAVLQATAAILILRDGWLAPADSRGTPISRDSMLPVLLEGTGEPCAVGEHARRSYFHLLSASDRTWIEATGTVLVLPVFAGRRGGPPVGVVALGPRANALSFTEDDRRFLVAAAAGATLACEGKRLTLDASAVATGVDEPELASQCLACGRVYGWNEPSACPCGGALEPAAVPRTVAGRFDVQARLGSGGMGVVYAATDRTLGRVVALKTLTTLSAGAAARLMVEARTMAVLAHPALAVLYGTEQWKDTPLLVMEHFEGGTLADRLTRSRLALSAAVQLTAKLADALSYLHGRGVHHGDIKPSNIAFTADQHPKFLDFGLCAPFVGPSASETAAGRYSGLEGTTAYMSPEVLVGAPVGPALDLWALALVLCESVTGHRLKPAGIRWEHLHDLERALAVVDTRDAGWLRGFLATALARDPRRRFPDARAFRHALGAGGA